MIVFARGTGRTAEWFVRLEETDARLDASRHQECRDLVTAARAVKATWPKVCGATSYGTTGMTKCCRRNGHGGRHVAVARLASGLRVIVGVWLPSEQALKVRATFRPALVVRDEL